MTCGQALRNVVAFLAEAGKSQSVAAAEAEQLLGAIFREKERVTPTRMMIFSRAAEELSGIQLDRLWGLAREVAAGRPVQQVIGYQQFLEHEYEVSAAVLIPRPETEVLVTTAIGVLASGAGGGAPLMGLEVGAGSGIISIELLARFPALRIFATELSSAAREVALGNAQKILGGLGALRLNLLSVADPFRVLAPLVQALDGARADFLISNPPYLLPTEAQVGVTATEPSEALFAPDGDPLFFYREFAQGLSQVVRPGGFGFFELPHERASAILALLSQRGLAARVVEDLTGRPRVLVVRVEEESSG